MDLSSRVVKVGVSIMGLGYVHCAITAHSGTGRTYFSATKVDVKNTHFVSIPASALAGRWELLDATKQCGTMTQDWDQFVNPG